MDLLLKLPKSLQSKIVNQDVPLTIIERLNYLWNASNNLAIDSPELAHRLSRAFVMLSNEFDMDLPEYILTRLCRHCNGIQIPSKTCRFRMRTRSRHSRVNRNAKEKIKDEIVMQCTLCNKSSFKMQAFTKAPGLSADPDAKGIDTSLSFGFGDSEQSAASKKRSLMDMKQQFTAPSSSTGSSLSAGGSGNPRFSFLNKSSAMNKANSSGSLINLDKRQTATGRLDNADFISFSGSNANNYSTGTNNGNNVNKMHKSNSTSNIGVFNGNNNKNGINSLANGNKLFTSQFVGGGGGLGLKASQSSGSISSMSALFSKGLSTAAPAKPPLQAMNLLELERLNKKKRKSLGKEV